MSHTPIPTAVAAASVPTGTVPTPSTAGGTGQATTAVVEGDFTALLLAALGGAPAGAGRSLAGGEDVAQGLHDVGSTELDEALVADGAIPDEVLALVARVAPGLIAGLRDRVSAAGAEAGTPEQTVEADHPPATSTGGPGHETAATVEQAGDAVRPGGAVRSAASPRPANGEPVGVRPTPRPEPGVPAPAAGADGTDSTFPRAAAASAPGTPASEGLTIVPSTTAAPLVATGAEAPPTAAPTAPSTAHAPLVARVMDALDILENAPPPRRMTVEVPDHEGLRLHVVLRGTEVHVSVRGGSPADLAGWSRDLTDGLAARGFSLGGFSDESGQERHRDPHDQQPDTPPPPPAAGRRVRADRPDDQGLRL